MHVALFAFALALTAADPALPEIGTAPPADVEIERAARDFRIETYQTFRLDREVYDRHMEAGQEIFAAWRQRDGSPQRREAVLTWYEDARELVRAGEVSPLSVPEFVDQQAEEVAATPQETPANELPEVIIEFFTPADPPPAATTPLPPLEQPPATGPSDETTYLDDFTWEAEVESFDLEFGSELNNELAARSDDYNQQVLAIVTELGGDIPWTSSNLEPLAQQLNDLARQRQALEQQWELQAPTAGAVSQELLSLQPSLLLLGQRLEEARRNVDYLDQPSDRKFESQRIDKLTRLHERLTIDN